MCLYSKCDQSSIQTKNVQIVYRCPIIKIIMKDYGTENIYAMFFTTLMRLWGSRMARDNKTICTAGLAKVIITFYGLCKFKFCLMNGVV